MKEKLLITLITIIIFAALGVVFLYGQKVITSESVSGYSVVSFPNPSARFLSDKNKESDVFGIEVANLDIKKIKYNISFLVNEEEFAEKEISIHFGSIMQVEPPSEFYEKLSGINKNETFEYSVEIQWDESLKTLTKKVTKE